MNAGNVTGSGATNAYYQNLHAKRGVGKDVAAQANAAAGDNYTSGTNQSGGVYSKDATVQKLWSMAEAAHANMRGVVESMIGGTSGQNGQAFWAMAANGGGQVGGAGSFKVDEATQAKAQELIGEDGYFGVKKTASRIMEFAVAMAGEGADEKTIEKLRGGVQAGFDYVAKLFGGFDKLPQLTKDTYDAVMQQFDDWVSGTKPVEA